MLKTYRIVGGVNKAITIGITLKIIIGLLEFPTIFIIVCTDLYFLYKYLVKLNIIKEKHLIITIIAL